MDDILFSAVQKAILRVGRIQAELGEVLEDLKCASGVGDVYYLPVGISEAPAAQWYCAQYHTYRDGAGHTGIDLNLDRAPWGDVDRGLPVWTIGAGIVHDAGYSQGWLQVVVVKMEWAGAPLWVRYAHLDPDSVGWQPGAIIGASGCVGNIGDYTSGVGGDHLHLDMARSPFGWGYWRTRSVDWVDPVPILAQMVGEAPVEAMLRRGG